MACSAGASCNLAYAFHTVPFPVKWAAPKLQPRFRPVHHSLVGPMPVHQHDLLKGLTHGQPPASAGKLHN